MRDPLSPNGHTHIDSHGESRKATRRQTAAAVMLIFFSMFSPVPDLRPKPHLPIKYQAAKPSDPPEFDFAVRAPGDEPAPAHKDQMDMGTPKAGNGAISFQPFLSEQARAQYLAHYARRALDWPVPCHTLSVTSTFGSTFVRVSGPVDAPPVVLLHGISSTSLAWIPNIAALAQHHRVYAVDHIADGGRSVPTQTLTSRNDHMRWLDDVLDSLGLTSNVNLVGLSYGGWLTAQYALTRNPRLAKIVLIAPAGVVMPLSIQWVVRAVACALPGRYFIRSFLRWLLPDLAHRSAKVRPNFEEIVADAIVTQSCLAPHSMVPPTVLADSELRSLDIPALYLVGEHEKICSPMRALERLRSVAPQIAAHLIPDAGHDLTLAQTDNVNRLIVNFLASPNSLAVSHETPTKDPL